MIDITKSCPNYDSWGEENSRLAALDMVNQLSYLCDQAYFDEAIEAIKQNKPNQFKATCNQAGVCEDLIPLLWKILKAAIDGPAAGWLPL